MKTNDKSKHTEGKKARRDGKAEEDNPYIPYGYKGMEMSNKDAQEWYAGYCEARDDEDKFATKL